MSSNAVLVVQYPGLFKRDKAGLIWKVVGKLRRVGKRALVPWSGQCGAGEDQVCAESARVAGASTLQHLWLSVSRYTPVTALGKVGMLVCGP